MMAGRAPDRRQARSGGDKKRPRTPDAGARKDLAGSAQYPAYHGSMVPLVKSGLPLKVIMVLTGGLTSVEVLTLKR
jgi:hypothetical protein